jgi:hypothetical protein
MSQVSRDVKWPNGSDLTALSIFPTSRLPFPFSRPPVLVLGQIGGGEGHPGDHLNPTPWPYSNVKHGGLESAPGLMTVAER